MHRPFTLSRGEKNQPPWMRKAAGVDSNKLACWLVGARRLLICAVGPVPPRRGVTGPLTVSLPIPKAPRLAPVLAPRPCQVQARDFGLPT
jgi:hypothetical protein